MKTPILFLLLTLANLVINEAHAEPATVVQYHGKVLINGKLISEGKVQLGSTIDTSAKNSRIILRAPGGRILRFTEGVAKYQGPTLVEVLKGKLFAFVRKVPEKNQKFEVRTRTAAMGVRGTKFLVLEDEKESYLCVCEGLVAATKKDQPNKSVNVGAGWDLSIQEGKALGEPTKASNMMWEIASKGFEEMGVPIKVPEKPDAK